MISKKISLSALLLIGFNPAIHSEISNSALAEAYSSKEAEWKYLEAKFVVEPSNKYASQSQKSRAIAFALIASSVLALKISSLQEYTICGYDYKVYDPSNLKMDLPTVSAGVLGLVGFEAYANYINANIKHNTLVNFLKDWEFHKKHVPTSLIPAFDELAVAFNNSKTKTFTTEQVSQIFEVIQHLLEHTFAGRYKPQEEKKESIFAVFKTITDISKNLAPK